MEAPERGRVIVVVYSFAYWIIYGGFLQSKLDIQQAALLWIGVGVLLYGIFGFKKQEDERASATSAAGFLSEVEPKLSAQETRESFHNEIEGEGGEWIPVSFTETAQVHSETLFKGMRNRKVVSIQIGGKEAKEEEKESIEKFVQEQPADASNVEKGPFD